MSDEFIREIEEDMRRLKAQAVWKKYEKPFYALTIGALVLTGAHAGWKSYTESRNAKATHELLTAMQEQDAVTREKNLTAFVDSHKGNAAALARLNLAAIALEGGKQDKARAQYMAIAQSDADAAFKDLSAAELKALDASEGKVTEASPSLGVFQASMKESVGWGLLQSGKKDEALGAFRELSEEENIPPATKARAEAVAAYLAEGE